MNAILERLRRFREDRGWRKYHNPDQIAAAIAIEAGELLDCFIWRPPRAPKTQGDVEAELADVMILCLNLCDVLDIDPIGAMHRKMDRNEAKYPVL